MKIIWTLCCLHIFSLLGLAASTLDANSMIDKLTAAKEKMVKVQDVSSGVPFSEIQRCGKELDGILTQVVAHAFADQPYDRTNSFLATVLRRSDVAKIVVPRICVTQFPRTPISNGERSRLCNFLIKTLYENDATNTDACGAIRFVLYFNDYPEVYSPGSREMVKKLIIENRLHFFYADVVGVTADKDIRAYLMPIANGEGRYKGWGFNQTWLASCMLAKAGDKAARKRVDAEADHLSDLHKAMYIPLGMAYLGDKEMVLRLFKMLTSDLKKWNGADAIPEETQLAHEAAIVLSICVKGFPKYNSYSEFAKKDKSLCIKWVDEHRDSFIIENRSPLYYLKNTRLDSMVR